MCGRVVKCKILKDSEVRDAQRCASRSLGKDSTIFDLRAEEQREGVLRMLTHVSPKDFQPADYEAMRKTGDESKAKFTPVDLQKLMTPGDPLSFEEMFMPRDIEKLCQVYSMIHQLALPEVTGIRDEIFPLSLD
jgi:hypothetical protein